MLLLYLAGEDNIVREDVNLSDQRRLFLKKILKSYISLKFYSSEESLLVNTSLALVNSDQIYKAQTQT